MNVDEISKLSNPQILAILEKCNITLNLRKESSSRQNDIYSVWSEELAEETDYWEQVINGTHKRDADYFRKRVENHTTKRFQFFELFDNPLKGPLKVLDVGAGPLTQIGLSNPSGPIEVTAVDPLADKYNKLLDDAGINPEVRTQAGTCEGLLEMFQLGSFDVVYSNNALDHAFNPVEGIANMVSLCRPGGIVHIEGRANVGEFNFYSGLHQWNFMAVQGDLIIWRPTEQYSLQKRLGTSAIVQSVSRMNAGAWLHVTRILKTG